MKASRCIDGKTCFIHKWDLLLELWISIITNILNQTWPYDTFNVAHRHSKWIGYLKNIPIGFNILENKECWIITAFIFSVVLFQWKFYDVYGHNLEWNCYTVWTWIMLQQQVPLVKRCNLITCCPQVKQVRGTWPVTSPHPYDFNLEMLVSSWRLEQGVVVWWFLVTERSLLALQWE